MKCLSGSKLYFKVEGQVRANFLHVCFIFHKRLLVTGYKRPLEDEDLWELSEPIRAASILNRVRGEWEREVQQHHQ